MDDLSKVEPAVIDAQNGNYNPWCYIYRKKKPTTN